MLELIINEATINKIADLHQVVLCLTYFQCLEQIHLLTALMCFLLLLNNHEITIYDSIAIH